MFTIHEMSNWNTQAVATAANWKNLAIKCTSSFSEISRQVIDMENKNIADYDKEIEKGVGYIYPDTEEPVHLGNENTKIQGNIAGNITNMNEVYPDP